MGLNYDSDLLNLALYNTDITGDSLILPDTPYEKDTIKLDGYNDNLFDLGIEVGIHNRTDRYSAIIYLQSGGDLAPSDFDLPFGDGVTIGLHLLGLGEGSIWCGATSVPIPGSVLLLGSGLAGFIGYRRRAMNRKQVVPCLRNN